MLPDPSRMNIRLGSTEEAPAVASGVEEMVTVAASAGCAARQTRPAAMSRAIGVLRVIFIFPSSTGGGSLGADKRLGLSDRVARSHRRRRDAVVCRRLPGDVGRRAGVD